MIDKPGIKTFGKDKYNSIVKIGIMIKLFPVLNETIENIKGIPLFLYSDGLNEAENKEQVQFSDERILEILSDQSLDNAKKVILKMMDEVNKHRNGAEPNDDLTMMCLRID